MSLGGSVSSHFAQLAARASNGKVMFNVNDGSGTVAETSTPFSTGVWEHYCAVEAAADDRRVYLNGGSKGTDATSKTPTLDRTAIGAILRSSAAGYWSGFLSLPTVWSVALSDAEVASLAAGAPPESIRPESIVSAWDLDSGGGLYDRFGQLTLSATGTTESDDHPPVWRPSGAILVPAAAAAGNARPLVNGGLVNAHPVGRLVA